MLQQGGGAIILVGSPTGYLGCAPGYTAYSASKGGVIGLTRIMAVDYGRDQIRVNTLVPGTTETPLIEGVLQQAASVSGWPPPFRWGVSVRVRTSSVSPSFLASDESRFCTGGIFMVDGGMSAM